MTVPGRSSIGKGLDLRTVVAVALMVDLLASIIGLSEENGKIVGSVGIRDCPGKPCYCQLKLV
jgi:hypothetical protein